jgi:hypothetical protein
LGERDVAVAQNALDIFGDIPLTDYGVHLNRHIIEGVIARMTNNADTARMAFAAARAQHQKIVCAKAGAKSSAFADGERRNQWPSREGVFCHDCRVGWRKRPRLRTAGHRHSPTKHGQLGSIKILAVLGSTPDDPRFEKFVASLAPKEEANK